MEIDDNIFDVLILLGSIQGLISAFLLINSSKNKKPNRFLSFLLILLSLACLNIYLFASVAGSKSFIYEVLEAVVPLIVFMPIGPLIYLYTLSLLNKEFTFSNKDKTHLYPIVLDLLPYFISTVLLINRFIGFIDSTQSLHFHQFIDAYQKYIDFIRWVSITAYLVLSFKELRKISENKKTRNQYKFINRLIILFASFQFIWFFYLIFYFIPQTSDLLINLLGWYPLYIPLIFLVYWIGINGFIITMSTREPLNSKPILDSNEENKILDLINETMIKDKLYLNSDFNLSSLVEKTNIPQKQVSHVLNQKLGKSFNEYVNGFRIEEVKKMLLDKKFNHLTILGIAFECGFKSQATFQRAFKAVTNQSPKEFRKENNVN